MARVAARRSRPGRRAVCSAFGASPLLGGSERVWLLLCPPTRERLVSTTAGSGTGPAVAMQGVPPVVQLPPSVFDSLMEILRENRLAQLATIDQQRELTRYMRGLNEWLERGVHDRQAELRGVVARVDQLRDDIRARAIPAQGAPGPPGGDDSSSSDGSDGPPVILPDQGRPVIPPPPFGPWQPPLGFQPYPVIPPDEDPRTFIPPRTDIPFIPDNLFPPIPPLLFQP